MCIFNKEKANIRKLRNKIINVKINSMMKHKCVKRGRCYKK